MVIGAVRICTKDRWGTTPWLCLLTSEKDAPRAKTMYLLHKTDFLHTPEIQWGDTVSPVLLLHMELCMCVFVFGVPWGQRSSSRCTDRSIVCGVVQHQQPDRGQTVDLWCQQAEMTCFCHWVCAPSREALNYIGTVLTDMFVIQSVFKIPSKGYYCSDKPLNLVCMCVCACASAFFATIDQLCSAFWDEFPLELAE